MGAFQCQCEAEGKAYTEIDVYYDIIDNKSLYVGRLGRAVKPAPSSNLTM